jgi:hypothetical protein
MEKVDMMHQNKELMNALVEFEEKQWVNQWWVWLIVIAVTVGAWYTAYIQLIQGIPVGTNPASDTGVILIWIGMGLLFPLFMITSNLNTAVDQEGIHLASLNRIFIRRFIPFESIKQVYIKQSNPILEYGGWGNRGWGKKKAYLIHGNIGLQLVLKNDSTIFIGSDKPEEFLNALQGHLAE